MTPQNGLPTRPTVEPLETRIAPAAAIVLLADLNGSNGFRITGAAAGDYAGHSVSDAGDVNGDGYADIILGAPGADGAYTGASYVVFGRKDGFSTSLDLSTLDGTNGFKISAETTGDQAGYSVSAAGDVNGDGFADLLIGAPHHYGGGTYVVFGKANGFTADLNLSSLNGTNGFRVVQAYTSIGYTVSGGGDVNGDGFDDLFFTSDLLDDPVTSNFSYIVFGKAVFAPSFDLATLDGTNGTVVKSPRDGYSHLTIDSAGDVNGDGFDDLLIGQSDADSNGARAGATYVLFGKSSFARLTDLTVVDGNNGFKISGVATRDYAGYSVSGAGDMNGDGIDDLVIGAPGVNNYGAAYVIFGKAAGFQAFLDLSSLDGSNGFQLAEFSNEARIGVNVSGAGDVNGDGFSDVVIATGINVSFVVLGKDTPFSKLVGLDALDGSDGFQIVGPSVESGLRKVSAAGDMNGDGFDDLILGNPNAGGDNSGAAYVLFGKKQGPPSNFYLSALDGGNGVQITGEAPADYSGARVSDAGDINGDGIDDVIIGAYGASPHGLATGAAYVVFGRSGGFGPTFGLANLDGSNGFRINGEVIGEGLGHAVSGAGDVNGDGFDDLILGVGYASPNGIASGASYVLFGKASGFASEVAVSSLDGTNGFKLVGSAAYDMFGSSVSGAGDVNGDGFADVIIGAPGADLNGPYSGAAYLIFGKASGFSPVVNVSALNAGESSVIPGEGIQHQLGRALSRAADVNRDGLDDVVIGAGNANASYAIFGNRAGLPATIDLSTLDGVDGFKVVGETSTDQFGGTVSGAGDINGDGFADILVGAPLAKVDGVKSGAAYCIFGNPTPTAKLNVATLDGANGFRVVGEPYSYFGRAISGAGDVNGDGFDEVVVAGANQYPPQGAVYVIFGRSDGFASSMKVLTLDGSNGFRINGENQGDYAGSGVSGGGDVNGDGAADIVIGALGADAGGGDSGSTYIVFGTPGAVLPSLHIDDISFTEGNGGSATATFTVSLSAASTQAVTVQYLTTNEAASAPGDYSALTLSMLTFLPGEVTKTISVNVVGDGLVEGDETFLINLSNAVNATIAKAQGRATIINDDAAVLAIGNATLLEGDSGTSPLAFVVTLSNPSTFPISVMLSTVNGTATAGADFTQITDQLVEFAPGDLSKTVLVPVVGDSTQEQNESFTVQLHGALNATVGTLSGTGTGTIIDDDSGGPKSSGVTFMEQDGDVVTISMSGGQVAPSDVIFAADGSIAEIDLSRFAAAQRAIGAKPLNFNIAVKAGAGGAGDGLTKVGLLNAAGLAFGKMKLQANVEMLLAGSVPGKTAAKSISIGGDFGSAAAQLSKIVGGIKKFSIGGAFVKGAVQVDGSVGAVVIKGDFIGDPALGAPVLATIAEQGLDAMVEGGAAVLKGVLLAESVRTMKIGGNFRGGGIATTKDLGVFSVLQDFSGGLFTEGSAKAVKVGSRMVSDDPDSPATITARNRLDSLIVGGDMQNARILVGYDKDETPVNPDAQVGKILVKGNWTASSLAVGINDSTNDGFGRNDSLIGGDTTPSLLSRIASITIKGTATGSTAAGDHFGITAQLIGKLSIGGAKVPLTGDADDILLDIANQDFRVVEIG